SGSSSTPDVISFKGANGTNRTIKIYHAMLDSVLRKHPDGTTEYTIKPFHDLFPSLQNVQDGDYDITVTSAVELPDGRQYQLRYDSYGNLAEVILPTGGRMEYDWTVGTYQFGDHVKGTFSRVLERRTAIDTTTTVFESRTTYAASVTYDPGQNYHFTNVTVDSLDPKNGNALLTRSKHYFYGDWLTDLSQ